MSAHLNNELSIKELIQLVDGIFLELDQEGSIQAVNAKVEELCGLFEQELQGKNWIQTLVAEEFKAQCEQYFQESFNPNQDDFPAEFKTEFVAVSKDHLPIALHSLPQKNQSGDISSVLILGYKVSKAHELERQISDMAHFPLDNPNPVLRINKEHDIELANAAAQTLLVKISEIAESNQTMIQNWNHLKNAAIKAKENLDEELVVGDRLYLFNVVPSKLNNHVNLYGTDITSLKKYQLAIEKMAFFDSLTALPNRLYLVQEITKSLNARNNDNINFAVYMLDIDDFKNINDLYGHTVGDNLLKEISARLTSMFTDVETISRLGGDEFILLKNNIENKKAIEDIANRILAAIRKPFKLEKQSLNIETSIGLIDSHLIDSGTSAEQVLQKVDIALNEVKQTEKGKFEFYRHAMEEESLRNFSLSAEILPALKAGEFLLKYQPQIHLKDHSIAGCEVLLRWASKDYKIVWTNFFIIF